MNYTLHVSSKRTTSVLDLTIPVIEFVAILYLNASQQLTSYDRHAIISEKLAGKTN
jgi:hypothetical protein